MSGLEAEGYSSRIDLRLCIAAANSCVGPNIEGHISCIVTKANTYFAPCTVLTRKPEWNKAANTGCEIGVHEVCLIFIFVNRIHRQTRLKLLLWLGAELYADAALKALIIVACNC